MRKRVGAQPDLFQPPAPAIGLPEFLSGKAWSSSEGFS